MSAATVRWRAAWIIEDLPRGATLVGCGDHWSVPLADCLRTSNFPKARANEPHGHNDHRAQHGASAIVGDIALDEDDHDEDGEHEQQIEPTGGWARPLKAMPLLGPVGDHALGEGDDGLGVAVGTLHDCLGTGRIEGRGNVAYQCLSQAAVEGAQFDEGGPATDGGGVVTARVPRRRGQGNRRLGGSINEALERINEAGRGLINIIEQEQGWASLEGNDGRLD